jgi:hypothetical protein
MVNARSLSRVIAAVWVLCAIVAGTHLALARQVVPETPSVSCNIGHIQVQEGSDFFTLEVQGYVRGQERQASANSCNMQAAEALDALAQSGQGVLPTPSAQQCW